MKPFIYKFRPSYSETDQGGIIHHSAYAKWFEDARVALLRAHDVPLTKLEKEDRYGLAVVNMNINYHRPAYFDDELTMELTIAKLGRASVDMHYVIRRGDETLTTASTRLATINLDRMRACLMPASLDKAFR